jgi:hypothetical protein
MGITKIDYLSAEISAKDLWEISKGYHCINVLLINANGGPGRNTNVDPEDISRVSINYSVYLNTIKR